jgi:hypothetical protein
MKKKRFFIISESPAASNPRNQLLQTLPTVYKPIPAKKIFRLDPVPF